VPALGRRVIYDTLSDYEVNFSWIEVQAQHAFIRDELSKGR
jgi:carboxymethylenebutenolidase